MCWTGLKIEFDLKTHLNTSIGKVLCCVCIVGGRQIVAMMVAKGLFNSSPFCYSTLFVNNLSWKSKIFSVKKRVGVILRKFLKQLLLMIDKVSERQANFALVFPRFNLILDRILTKPTMSLKLSQCPLSQLHLLWFLISN